jgi:hypothetical protein
VPAAPVSIATLILLASEESARFGFFEAGFFVLAD